MVSHSTVLREGNTVPLKGDKIIFSQESDACFSAPSCKLRGINFPSTPHHFTFYTLSYHFFFYEHISKASVREKRPWGVAQCSLPNSERAQVFWVQHLPPCSDFSTVTTFLVVASPFTPRWGLYGCLVYTGGYLCSLHHLEPPILSGTRGGSYSTSH